MISLKRNYNINNHMNWHKENILEALKERFKQGADLSYNGLARRDQPLVSAAAYHFGSYRAAVEKAGIDYAAITRRPRWTKPRIVALIKMGYRDKQDLQWSAVTKRRDELGKAAFASLQPRLFGRWDAALEAAGLKVEDVSRYRQWDRHSILEAIKTHQGKGKAINSGAMQQDDPGLHAAAVRYFGKYDAALKSAKINPASVRRRRTWTPDTVLKLLKQLDRQGERLSDGDVRRNHPALYGAAVRLLGSFTMAREKAGVKFER